MSDQNPPEQGAFGSPAPGSPGTGPTPGGPGPQAGAPGEPVPAAPTPSTPSTPPPASAGGPGTPAPPPPTGPGGPASPGHPVPPQHEPHHEPHQPHGGPGSLVTSGGEALADSSAGFFPALFDFSFNTFVTPKIVRIVYVLAVVWAAVGYVFAVIGGFASSITTGLAALLFGPIVAIIWLAVVRIGLEFGISVVRMSEDVHRRLPQA